MRILSLFDGISAAQVAINNLGVKDYTYYASEVDKYAIQIKQKNFPNTIQIGDVCNTQRYKSLGNSFTVPVIEHILRGII